MNYPELIKSLRQNLIISQSELAEILGTNKVTISRWENGKFVPNYKYRRKLQELFIEHVLKGEKLDV